MSSLFHRNMHRRPPEEDSDLSTDEDPLFQQDLGGQTRINCISVILQLIVAALLIYKASKNIECDDPERRLSDRVHLLNNIVTGLILVITAVNVFITAFWFSPLHSTPEDQNFLVAKATEEC
ncbi:uncharacterized protein LOC134578723 isoform X2 [Pelobates fuscus]|uniref:uncharacterized protein LOC134578723 isoform X2 n=1 Tax=Pelobates fuscus TaxID=191477 RepID=UPI002FE4FA2E